MTISRRRVLKIFAGCVLAAGAPAGAKGGSVVWRGRALGADAEFRLAGHDPKTAEAAIAAAKDTLRRMEDLFSLYREGSAINRLNRDGRLEMPPEFIRLVRICSRVHELTGGLFDPTVQPLMVANAATRSVLTGSDLQNLSKRIGWAHVGADATSLSFTRPGMAITLNGIAQGFATDRIVETFRAQGYEPFLVQAGELRAGRQETKVGVLGADLDLLATTDLQDGALATSAPSGTRFENGCGHILRPDLKPAVPRWRSVTVEAETASLADGLSTALALTTTPALARRLSRLPEVRKIWLEEGDGSLVRI